MAITRKIKSILKILIVGVLVSFVYFLNRDEVGSSIDAVIKQQQLVLKHTHSPAAVVNYSTALLSSSVALAATTMKIPIQAIKNDKSTQKAIIVQASEQGLAVHIWKNFCGGVVKNLKEHPLFPRYPDKTTRNSCLKLNADEKRYFFEYGLRQYGFLVPQISGSYGFAIYSDDSSELWLSDSESSKNLKLVASVGDSKEVGWTNEGNINKYGSQKSSLIYLESGRKYFIEVLFKQMKLLDHYGVLWKSPGNDEYKDIPCHFLHSTVDEVTGEEYDGIVGNPAHSTAAIAYLGREDEIVRFSRLPFISDAIIQDILPICDYEPSYLVKRKLNRYEGVYQDQVLKMNAEIYPEDETAKYIQTCNYKATLSAYDCQGNRVLDPRKATLVTSLLMKAINAKLGRDSYTLKSIFNVEGRMDDEKGNRYLLELELMDSNNRSVRFSEYVFQPRDSTSLCYPKNYRWNKNATINIISTARNQPGWVQHLINSVASVQRKTSDMNINLIISDYGNGDLDVEEVIKKSGIKRYQVMKRTGNFYKTEAIQEASAQVKNPDDIVFQLDLHLDIPVNLFDYVRKHCIPGKMTVTPVVMRLSCGHFPSNPGGHWETAGYGLFGFVKRDWDNIGGMNVQEFKNTWGGEDWELCDRTLMKGYEIERLRLTGLYHYYHDHNHLWDGKTSDKNK